jgi:hypothetical protein
VSGVQLRPLLLQLERQSGSLRAQIEAAVHAHGTPLRWAITAVQHRPNQPPLLQIEAVVLTGIDPERVAA